jgi:hypothetical protein
MSVAEDFVGYRNTRISVLASNSAVGDFHPYECVVVRLYPALQVRLPTVSP